MIFDAYYPSEPVINQPLGSFAAPGAANASAGASESSIQSATSAEEDPSNIPIVPFVSDPTPPVNTEIPYLETGIAEAFNRMGGGFPSPNLARIEYLQWALALSDLHSVPALNPRQTLSASIGSRAILHPSVFRLFNFALSICIFHIFGLLNMFRYHKTDWLSALFNGMSFDRNLLFMPSMFFNDPSKRVELIANRLGRQIYTFFTDVAWLVFNTASVELAINGAAISKRAIRKRLSESNQISTEFFCRWWDARDIDNKDQVVDGQQLSGEGMYIFISDLTNIKNY